MFFGFAIFPLVSEYTRMLQYCSVLGGARVRVSCSLGLDYLIRSSMTIELSSSVVLITDTQRALDFGYRGFQTCYSLQVAIH
jgi:hypothetical protein